MSPSAGIGGAPRLVVIAGPTAVGKTGLAVRLAQRWDAEIVGADSMQVYRGLDIGTGKPTANELEGVPHWLLDVADPDEPFDASRYLEIAGRAIADVVARGRRVVVAGGTGLYLRALLHGLHQGPTADPELRGRLEKRAASEGWPALHAELARVDGPTAERLHPNDGVRILRALEVLEVSGVPMSEWQRHHRFDEQRYPCLLLGLERPRDELHRRIESRVDEMMATGFLEEVRGLLERGYGPDLKPLQGLGYRRLCEHLVEGQDLAAAVEQIKTDTRRFARRQITWFNREPGLSWSRVDDPGLEDRVQDFWEEES